MTKSTHWRVDWLGETKPRAKLYPLNISTLGVPVPDPSRRHFTTGLTTIDDGEDEPDDSQHGNFKRD